MTRSLATTTDERMVGARLILGDELMNLIQEQSTWSQVTFGTDANRGPIGALKHLADEAKEAWENPSNFEEYADCLLLLLDATRRNGYTILELVNEAQAKLEKNKLRKWGPIVGDEAIHHVKEG